MLDRNVANGEVFVPQGEYFVLGDNRNSSLDSRYWGFIADGDIIGKPFLIYHSAEESADRVAPLQNLFVPRRTRWNRVFELL